MLHRINKSVPAVWVDPTTLQLGLGNNQIRLAELTLEQQKIIDALYSGIVQGQEDVLDQTLNTDTGQTAALIEKLKPLIQSGSTPSYGSWNELGFSELARTAMDYQVNAEMVLAERFQRTVHIDQLDKTGLLLTKALLASGVGHIVSHDEAVVLSTDLGELGYPRSYIHQSRFRSALEILQESTLVAANAKRLRNLAEPKSKDQKISFAVTVGHLALNPRTYNRWLSRDVPHIAILFETEQAMVSPVILPGVSACLNCYQESLVDEDLAWPVIASQLLDLPRVRDDAAGLLSVTGLAVRSILRSLDEQAGFEHTADQDKEYRLGYRIEYSTGNIYRMRFEKHKLCSCLGVTEIELDSDSEY